MKTVVKAIFDHLVNLPELDRCIIEYRMRRKLQKAASLAQLKLPEIRCEEIC